MYEPLHHKYRPQTFAQLVGQGAIAATLTNALQQNRIAPAYLFCGPRGTGKTSSARILAKSLNCLKVDSPTATPCGECDVCVSVSRGSSLDIVEIDAASNTGVDNIRELIERSQFAPVQCRYKVYVVDECHMLSVAAFNALLKTLEEPPDRVVFVLATTDPQRVLPTIISRCQRFDFRRIPLPSMIKHLQYIATEESIDIAESATQLVAQISQGGLRDAESLLDQLSLQADEITVESVWNLVGAVPERDLLNLVRAIAADDGTALLERVRHLMDKGREPLIVLQSLVGFYRDLLIAQRAPTRDDLVAITPPTWAEMTEFAQRLSASALLASQQKLQTSEVQVKNTTQPRLWLEITLMGLLPSSLGAVNELSTVPTSAPPPISPPTASSVVAPPISAPNRPASPQSASKSSPPAPAQNKSAPSASPAVSPSESELTPSKSPSKSPAAPPPEDTAAEDTAGRDTVESPPEVSFGSMSDLWNKILAVLSPRGTQMLMAQQGKLLAFDGVGAKVGFRSLSLQKMGQERIPNLEAAFNTVFQRPIKVSLEIVTADKAPDKDSEDPHPASPAPPIRQSPVPQAPTRLPSDRPADGSLNSPPAQNLSTTDSESSKNSPNATSKNQSFGHSQAEDVSPSPTDNFSAKESFPNGQKPPLPSENNNRPASRLDAPTDSVSFDQDQEKVKRFANFFNGEIVNLDDDEPGAASDTKSSDPGPDVPF